MKNFNDAGTVHFDASTNAHYTVKTISFYYRLEIRTFDLAIPLTMRDKLNSAHYDSCIPVAKREIDRVAILMMKRGDFRPAIINRECNLRANLAMLEHLYNEFTVEQARLGNQVWATPELMQDVGSKPENDVKYLQ